MHLIVDGYGGDPLKMADETLILEFLDRYPSQIGMTKIMDPQVLRYIGAKPEDWGVSGFVIIAESHISIHTFPERSYINIDIFSCKEFDTDRALQDLEEVFGLAEIESRIIERGLEYPHHVQMAAAVVRSERTQVATSLPVPACASHADRRCTQTGSEHRANG